jgi:hypothetical protein
MTYIIEDNVPVRDRPAHKSALTKTLEKMQPRQSILVPYSEHSASGKEQLTRKVRGRCTAYGTYHGIQFSVAKEMSGVRVWRVK